MDLKLIHRDDIVSFNQIKRKIGFYLENEYRMINFFEKSIKAAILSILCMIRKEGCEAKTAAQLQG